MSEQTNKGIKRKEKTRLSYAKTGF